MRAVRLPQKGAAIAAIMDVAPMIMPIQSIVSFIP